MNEISYYEEFSKKFSQYLNSYLGNGYKVFYSCNNTLDILVKNLETLSGFTINPKDTYIPKLKVDILFAICENNKTVKLILIEAKYLPQLRLKDYSQLVGYLQVAKIINIGLLLLVQKGISVSRLSNEFQEIIRLKKLPMNWLINLIEQNAEHSFKTGIIGYLPGNGVDWVDTREIHGISSFEDLSKAVKYD